MNEGKVHQNSFMSASAELNADSSGCFVEGHHLSFPVLLMYRLMG